MEISKTVKDNINLTRLHPDTVKVVRKFRINKREKWGGRLRTQHQKGVTIKNIVKPN